MTRTVAAALLALTLLAGACSGEDDDTPAAPGTTTASPSAVPVLGAWHELIATDGGGVVLVNGYPEGGADPGPVELWTWDGEQWTALEPDGERPSGRNFASVTWDDARGEVVLYGGLTPAGPSDETWTWDGTAWSLATGPGPGPRSSPSLAYDAASERVLLYGGDDGATQHNDTWAWDGAAWEQVATGGPTPMRWPAFLEQDPASGSPVMYGGHQVADEDGPPAIADTWVWSGDGWRGIRVGAQPGPLVNANGVVHPEHGLLLVGGSDFDGDNGRVWRWTGAGWERLGDDVMPPRQAFGLAYDAQRDVVVLTGGLVEPGSTERRQDVWEWTGDPAVPAEQVLDE